jgi:DNA-nicking Smr family endonuclease
VRVGEPPAPPPEPEDEFCVALPIEDALDLHPFAPADIPSVVEEYLRECRARGWREVRLIHGKGIGVQRRRVQALLARLDIVERFADAPPGRGHWGATLVWLKRSES